MYASQVVLEVVAVCQIDALTEISLIRSTKSHEAKQVFHEAISR